jgi:hypothetical protein
MNSIKDVLKKNTFIESFSKKIYYYYYPQIIFKLYKFLRLNFKCDLNRYSDLRKLKNIAKKNRCFIVATGPSLTIEDLEKLKNEDCFSMNSIVLLFDKTDWRPTYYGIQDPFVYEKIKQNVDEASIKYKLFGHRLSKYKLPKNSYVFPHNLLNHKIPHRPYNSKFSNDIYSEVYDGYSITYSLVQIAVYMGYKEIYLIGADTNYKKGKQHIVEHGVVDANYSDAGNKMIEAYKVAKKFADENQIEIYNATRGGMLEVFPRVDLDELLDLRKKEWKY